MDKNYCFKHTFAKKLMRFLTKGERQREREEGRERERTTLVTTNVLKYESGIWNLN
jgi:hypothetical protein